jgi:hypothetical protein
MSQYAVILFESTHDAIRADKLIRERIPVTLIPTPRRFSESCGIALRFETERLAEIEELIAKQEIQGTIHMMDDN